MNLMKHAFDWGYGYALLALIGALLYRPFIPIAYADNFMTATKLVNLSESDDAAERALSHGYVAAIHDELVGSPPTAHTCFAVPKRIDLQEMAERTIDFVDWFAHDLNGWPKDKDFMYPARQLVHLGLVKHFPCNEI